MRAAAAAALLVVAIVALAAPARATTCAAPDLLETIPPDKSTVPSNASLSARYDATAEYVDEKVVLDTPDGTSHTFVKTDGASVVSFDSTQGLLTFTPSPPLAPGTYTLHWPSLRGLNVATPGLGGAQTFTVSAAPDDAAPSFDGVVAVRWDLERKKNDCTDDLQNRMVFELDLAPADDDGGRTGLTLVVFQTAGGLVDAGSVPVLTEAMPSSGVSATVKLPVEDATGHVCFAALARDLTQKTSNGGSHVVCVETTAPPFFRGCAVAPTRGAGGAPWLGIALVVARARRRRAR